MKRSRAMSLYAVLVVVSIAALLVSCMATLYLTNLHFSLAANNGEIAHSQAEAALQEVIARIVYQSDYGHQGDESIGQPPDHGTGHWLSYAGPNGLVPQSLYQNDTGQSHVYAAGYCRGECRVLEAVIQPAEYSYALATEGPIESQDSFTARGVADVNLPDQTNRPGNVLTNSNVKFKGDVDISGSLRLAGTLDRTPPGTFIVGGGIEQGQARRTLPGLTLARVDGQLPQESKRIPVITDVIPESKFKAITAFDRKGNVSFEGDVEMQQGVIRVHKTGSEPGNLVIKHKLSGTGLLVVDGDVTIQEADMSGSGQILVVAGGSIRIKDGYFRGLLYSETRLKLSHCSVLGSAIVSPGPDTLPGATFGAEVDGVVTVIADPSGGHYTGTVNTYAGLKQGKSEAPFRLAGMGQENTPGAKSVGDTLMAAITSGNAGDLELDSSYNGAWVWDPDATGLYAALDTMKTNLATLTALKQAADEAEQAATDAGNAVPFSQADADAAGDAAAKARKKADDFQAKMNDDATNLAKAYQAFMDGHATGSGGVDGKKFTKESVEVTLDLQKFLARSESVRMIYYKERAMHRL